MNKTEAKNLIINTFEKPFEKEQFVNFIMNLLNLKSDEIIYKRPSTGIYTTKVFMDYIKSFYRIAKYEDDSGKKIDILIVKLKKETSLERARSMQRNFIAWYLKGSRGYYKDAALVAFVSPDNDDWRFSFVKIQYLFKESKTAEMLSSALRYSFLVGKNEISYTAQSQLIPFLLDDKNKTTLKMLEQAFSVEKVSDKFFQDYNELYKKAMKEFENNNVFKIILEQNSNLTVDLFVRKLLGQIVFMYFLQKKGWLGIKIDEPGWKNGNRKFLRWAFEDCKKKNKNYFDRFLQPLFYAGFNKKEELFQYDEFQFKIPFLNGGLFEELFHWESAFINPTNTLFSNDKIDKEGNIGTGILDIFDRYNFTIDENTRLEKEIAVDPEMLGKVFENLLPENLRKGKGTYYTPREIVAYMTKESLINYLNTKISADDSDDNSRTEEKIRRLFDYKDLYINKKNTEIKKHGKEFEQQFYEMLDIVEDVNKHLKAIKIVDPACGSGAFPMGILLEIVSLREYIENEFLDNKISNYKLKKDTIQNSIYGVDIDPGAVVIAKLRFWLSLVVDAEKPEPLPNLDYKIMQGNSLIESFEGIDLSKVMADKNFVITQIDSQMNLLGDNGKQQKFVFSDKRKETIISLKNKYYLATDPIKKKEIHKKIDKIVLEHIYYNLEIEKEELRLTLQELKNNLRNKTKNLHNFSQLKQLLERDKEAQKIREIKKEIFEIDKKFGKLKELQKSIERPYFLWHLFFSEIFENEDSGFDIVIANPPYVRQEKIRDQKLLLQEQGYKVYNSTSDLYTYFYELSYNLLKENGISTFISSNKWMRAKYGFKLRKFFKENTNINQIIDFGGYQVFDATVDTNIMMFQKPKQKLTKSPRFGNFGKDKKVEERKFNVYQIKDDFEKTQDLTKYFANHKLQINQNDLDINSFTFADEKVMNLKKKIEKIGTPLKDWDISIYRGIITGFNEAFIISGAKKDELIAKDSKSVDIIKPILRGRDIKRYKAEFSNLWVIIVKFGAYKTLEYEYPAVYDHLLQFKEKLKNRGQCRYSRGRTLNSINDYSGQHHWLELDNNPKDRYLKQFEMEKIVYQEMVQESSFVYDLTDNYFCLDTGRIITGESLKYVISIMNSKLFFFSVKQYYGGGSLGSKGVRMKHTFLENFPLPKFSEERQKQFEVLVDQILSDKKAGKDTQKLEDQIDLMVYKLYELTYVEVKIVDPETALSKVEYDKLKLEGAAEIESTSNNQDIITTSDVQKTLPEEAAQPTNLILTEFSVGQHVFHPTFGEGEVLHVTGSGEAAKLTVKFGRETKKLIAGYAKLSGV
ncbi:MAG: Eco57I restriction-modification methylase domain-containing protein [Candidatus Cloacimonetes bacterium]|nr:Eco57I restriction-modification methylase domain-containing protein [Candidatus Cloacimonadota bacterium]